jgi:hypothetical protein
MTSDLRDQVDVSFGDGPAHLSVSDRVAAGRAAVRRRRRIGALGAVTTVAVLALGAVVLRPATGAGDGGGGGGYNPPPPPTSTAPPTPVHLLVAPPSDVGPGSPPVVYLDGRMFRRDRGVTVLATFGDVDQADHPRGAAIVRVGGSTSWVLVVGNEPERISQQSDEPYDYSAFMTWASGLFYPMSGRLALAATAPGAFTPPVSDVGSPAVFHGDLLVAKSGGAVVQRVRDPVRDPNAVPSCHLQAVRIHTGGGDWFVLGGDCPQGGATLYSERAGVRADTLSSWLVQVKRVQDAYVH